MGVAMKTERGLLDADEAAFVERSHHPALGTLPRDEALALARWLRERRARARGLVHATRRDRRGKDGGGGPATPDPHAERGLSAKKAVFARAMKRVNARLDALAAEARREAATERLRVALAAKHDAPRHHPEAGWASSRGMRVTGAPRRRWVVDPRMVGSVSQAGRNAQASRDARGG